VLSEVGVLEPVMENAAYPSYLRGKA